MSFKLKIIVIGSFIIATTMIISSILSISSFEISYRKSIESQFEVLAQDLKNNIEDGLKKYKSYNHFAGIDQLFEELLKRSNGIIDSVSTTNADGKALYLSYQKNKQIVFQELIKDKDIYFDPMVFSQISESSKPVNTHLVNGIYIINTKVIHESNWLGNVIIIFSENVIKDKIRNVIDQTLIILGISLLTAIILIVINTIIFIKKDSTKKTVLGTDRDNKDNAGNEIQSHTLDSSKKIRSKIVLIIITVLILSQILFSYLSINLLQENSLDAIQQKTNLLANLLKEDVEYLVNKGLPIDKLVRIEVIMENIVKKTPEYANLRIADLNGNVLYFADIEKGVRNFETGKEKTNVKTEDSYNHLFKVFKPETKEQLGFIKVGIDEELIDKRIRQTLIDYITVIVVGMLFSFELLIFFVNRTLNIGTVSVRKREYRTPYQLIRTIAFFSFFSISLFASFLPIYIRDFSNPLWGLSKEAVASIPISIYMLASGVIYMLFGKLEAYFGRKSTFLIGCLFFAIGFFLIGIAENIVQIMIYHFIAGIGFGIIFLIPQSLVMDNTSPEERPIGLSNLFAGIFSGIICGSAIGGMLAERLGFRIVFFIAAIVILATFIFSHFIIKESKKKAVQDIKTQGILKKLMKDRNFIIPLITQGIPYQIIYVGFIVFLLPLYLKDLNISESDIGRVIMIHGLVIIFIGPLIIKYISNYFSHRFLVGVGGLLSSITLIGVYVLFGLKHITPTLLIIIPWIIVLAVSNSISGSGILSLSMESDSVKEIKSGQAVSYYRLIERIGNISGPILVGLLIGLPGILDLNVNRYEFAIGVLGIISFIGFVLFAIFAKGNLKNQILNFINKMNGQISSIRKKTANLFVQDPKSHPLEKIMFRNLKIGIKLQLAFSIVVVLLLIVTSIFFSYFIRDKVIEEALEKVSTGANTANLIIDNKIEQLKIYTQLIANDKVITNLFHIRVNRKLGNYLNDIVQREDIDSIIITNTSGVVVARSGNSNIFDDKIYNSLLSSALGNEQNSSELKNKPIAGIEMVSESETKNENLFSILHKHQRLKGVNETIALTAASSIFARDGKTIIGAVLARSLVGGKIGIVDKIKSITKMDVEIYQSDFVIATTLFEKGSKKRRYALDGLDKDIEKIINEKKSYEQVNISQDGFLAKYQPLTSFDGKPVGSIKVETSSARFAKNEIDLIKNSIMIIVISLIVVYVIQTLLSRAILLPIKELIKNAKLITEGELSKEIITKSKDEVGMLGETFETMRIGLKDKIDTIEDMNRNLESKVEDRTEEIKALVNKLRTYLPPQLYNSILGDAQSMGMRHERKKLTIFFSDIKGFTEITDSMESEQLSELLNHYLDEMTKIALKWGGTVDKFVGDAIMIFFGAPEITNDTDHALRCVKMAIEMKLRLSILRTEWYNKGFIKPLKARMGINTGYCTIGDFGSENRKDYTIIGGMVNIASRLESNAKPDEILISQETYALIRDKIECTYVDEIRVKGVHYPIKTYQIVGENIKEHRFKYIKKFDNNIVINNLLINPDRSPEELKEIEQALTTALKIAKGEIKIKEWL